MFLLQIALHLFPVKGLRVRAALQRDARSASLELALRRLEPPQSPHTQTRAPRLVVTLQHLLTRDTQADTDGDTLK